MMHGTRAALADRPDDAALLDDATLARLAVIAENPVAIPSHRVRARSALRRHREAIAVHAGDEAVALDLVSRIARGDALGWRDRARAKAVGLELPVVE